jgi:hypothetical protein
MTVGQQLQPAGLHRRRCGFHDQVQILAHEPEWKFRSVVVILDLSELSQKCGRKDGGFGKNIE